VLLLDLLQSADATADQHAMAIGIPLVQVDPGLDDSLDRPDHRELGKTVEPTEFFWWQIEVIGGIKISDLTAETDLKIVDIEPG
jgi:hypothetical protein